jgi:sugar phosphate isomerase/epimerase
MMRFACLTTAAPGSTLAEQCAAIAAAGCRGFETLLFPTTPLADWRKQVDEAAAAANLSPAVVILGGLALHQPSPLGWVEEAAAAVADLGAALLITPEYQPQNPLPLFPPFPAPPPHEIALVAAATLTISQACARHRVPLYLEPITQFEGRFWQRLEQVTPLCQHLTLTTGAQTGAVADLHNMNITEAAPLTALQQAGPWLRHVHLADNNRRLPGQGHIDFTAALHTLQRARYDGWYSFECAVEGDFVAALGSCIEQLSHSAAVVQAA